MTEFTASNGYRVELSGGAGYVRNVAGHERHVLGRYTIEALREYFQHERDEELGWWRDSATPGYIVRPDPILARRALVLHEKSWQTFYFDEGAPDTCLPSKRRLDARAIAQAYFDAHPAPRAWHDAKPEEVWLMGSGLHEFVAIVGLDGSFHFADGSGMAVTGEFVTGRRIWPEEDAS